jgi:glutathione S-transferase
LIWQLPFSYKANGIALNLKGQPVTYCPVSLRTDGNVGAVKRAQVRALATIVGGDSRPSNAKRFLEYPHKILGCNEAPMLRWRAEGIEAGFVALEALLALDAQRGRLCCGNSPTLANVSPVPRGKAPGVSSSI